MTVEDRLSHRIAGLTGAGLLVVAAVPLLWAPLSSISFGAGRSRGLAVAT